ncbi:EF-hand domain-containing protein [Psychrosphaera aquimarina]|uniref:EF-hand domain-containing protein n=1 Tax=Psychrosphaera aquimarina TaxID=2044854 RepID=A0ABU3QXM5_9GAMM|nr:EF-hand domain-containing protein [Psychrosphaera aquimarina]MDU0112034.1 EF-hand domain-containing protein [Psychrosphaera aquimarina]
MRVYSTILLSLVFSTASLVQAAPTMAGQESCSSNDNQGQKTHKQRPNFATLDINSDGDIDTEEFASHKHPHGDPQKIFVRIDADQNGVISKQEFEDHKPPHHKNKTKRGCND